MKEKLSELEYQVTQEKATEPSFTGKYWNHFENGKYKCIACDEILFNSEDKYYSACGWPAFSKESYQDTIQYVDDNSYNIKRTEILCKKCGSHLGHVFDDGPEPSGKRYCVNSASLNFEKER